MKLTLLATLSLASVALAAPAQQLPFADPRLSFSSRASLQSILPSLPSRLASLPEDHLSLLRQHVEDLPERRLVRFEEGGEAVEVTEGDKALLVLEGVRFIDVTDEEDKGLMLLQSSFAEDKFPKKVSHNSTVTPALKHIDIAAMKTFLEKFTSFYTRYYRSDTGRQSQQYLLQHLQSLVAQHNPKANVSITEFVHPWQQRSIIVRFEPTKPIKEEKIVILGAHQDSTNSLPFLSAPGADDDGSGSVTLVTVFTALLKEGFAPTSSGLEIHFYSAEEGGLLGSGEVSRAYATAGKSIRSMFHMDVVAFVKSGTKPRIGVISDNVSEPLTDFMRLLVTEYAEIDFVDTKCGYGCSDFASWTKVGAAAACLAEGEFKDTNTHMHSSSDTMNLPEFSFEHIAQFARVGIAYAIELGSE